MKLLTREQFRNKVFERDKYKCVICEKNAKDAHLSLWELKKENKHAEFSARKKAVDNLLKGEFTKI